jgi:hypothetical protein
MSSVPSSMLPGRSWGEMGPDKQTWVCPDGHETYEWPRDGRCSVCGAPLEESRVPSFRQKVRSRVSEPSQQVMDEILDDK